MKVDSRNEQNGFSLEEMRQQLRALSAFEPPGGLKEKLLAGVPRRATGEAGLRPIWRWPGLTGWASAAATILVFCGFLWLRTPVRPTLAPSPDANSLLSGVLAADYNAVRPADINTLDSNGLY